MPLPRFLSQHPLLAKWLGEQPAVPGQLPPQPQAVAMPAWLADRRIILVLAVAALLGILLMLKMFLAGAPHIETARPINLAPPPYQATYPAQTFTTKSPPRNIVFSELDDTAPTFSPLDPKQAELARKQALTPVDAKQQAAMDQRQFIASQGYSWSVAGFLEAARKGNLPVLQAYLKAGMPITARNAFSSTALHAAAEANQLEAAKLLIAAGSDVNAASTNLQTPLHRAVALSLPAMTQLLIAAGARIDATTLEGWTPLFYAVDNNNQNLASYLITQGTNPNRQDRFGNTPLMLAARKNYVDLSKKLINLGANMNATDLTGRTALHYAVSGGFYQLTKMLLENGAKADVTDRNGLLPMDIALANQDLSVANLLLANGAKRPAALGRSAPRSH